MKEKLFVVTNKATKIEDNWHCFEIGQTIISSDHILFTGFVSIKNKFEILQYLLPEQVELIGTI
jgi:hypothetical protein